MGMFMINPNFENDCKRQLEGMPGILTSKGGAVLSAAKGGAPVESGKYRNNIRGQFLRGSEGNPYYRVSAESDNAAAIEWGNSRARGTHNLRNALRKAT